MRVGERVKEVMEDSWTRCGNQEGARRAGGADGCGRPARIIPAQVRY
jgi:hypothetical protein